VAGKAFLDMLRVFAEFENATHLSHLAYSRGCPQGFEAPQLLRRSWTTQGGSELRSRLHQRRFPPHELINPLPAGHTVPAASLQA
jgi:hypothetical protein